MRIDGGSQSRLTVRCIPDGVTVWTAHGGSCFFTAHVGHGTACDGPQHTVRNECSERQPVGTTRGLADRQELVQLKFIGDSHCIGDPISNRSAWQRCGHSVTGSVDSNEEETGSCRFEIPVDRIQSTAWATMTPNDGYSIWASEGSKPDRSSVCEFDHVIHDTSPTIGSQVLLIAESTTLCGTR